MYVCVPVCVFVCLYVCVPICVFVGLYVCLFACMFVGSFVCTWCRQSSVKRTRTCLCTRDVVAPKRPADPHPPELLQLSFLSHIACMSSPMQRTYTGCICLILSTRKFCSCCCWLQTNERTCKKGRAGLRVRPPRFLVHVNVFRVRSERLRPLSASLSAAGDHRQIAARPLFLVKSMLGGTRSSTLCCP